MDKIYRGYSIPENIKVAEYSSVINDVKIFLPSKPEILVEEFLNNTVRRVAEFRETYSSREIPKIWEKAGVECKKLCMEHLEILSSITKFPKEALEIYIKNIFDNLKENYLLKITETELGNIEYLDRFLPGIVGYTKAYGPKYVVHIFPETIGPQPLSTFQASIVKAPSICKPASNELFFTKLWVDSLVTVDKDIGKYIWCIPWKSGNKNIENKLFSNERCSIIVYGNHQTIDDIKSNAKGSVLGYPFKAGIEIVEIKECEDIYQIAPKLVTDITYMDQCACFSPHIIYVISENLSYPKKLCEEIAKIMDNYPVKRKELDTDNKAIISMLKHTYLLKKTVKLDIEIWEGKDYLILYENDPSFELSPLFRTIRVKPIKSLNELKQILLEQSKYLQTIGTNLNKEKIADIFEDCNISRVVDIGKMPINKLHHHEGKPLILPLIKWIDIE